MLEAYHPETGQQAKNARLPAAWIFKPLMSEMGQSRHFGRAPITSGLPQQADVFGVRRHVSKVPKTDLRTLATEYDHKQSSTASAWLILC
jgi:hypothetical protein